MYYALMISMLHNKLYTMHMEIKFDDIKFFEVSTTAEMPLCATTALPWEVRSGHACCPLPDSQQLPSTTMAAQDSPASSPSPGTDSDTPAIPVPVPVPVSIEM